MLIVGLMSGTSLDGIDAALVRFEGDIPETLHWEVVRTRTYAFDPARREAIHGAVLEGSAEALCALHADLGEWLADAVLQLCEDAGIAPRSVEAVASHGQTIWHRPPTGKRRGATLQLGDPATIAERTGCDVISDFRARDVAAGGHGAPMVCFADRVLFSDPDRPRALQNIGGIANVTRVPARGSDEPLVAFDTGPGNALIDAAVELATRGAETFDRDGHWARRGNPDDRLMWKWLGNSYFERPPPKTTGREMFGRPLVERIVRNVKPDSEGEWANLIATLTQLTAYSIHDAHVNWIMPHGLDYEVVVTGGGARNPVLMEMLRTQFEEIPVRGGEVLGVDPEAKEAVAFAALGWAHLNVISGNEPSATGASGPRVLGSLTPGFRG